MSEASRLFPSLRVGSLQLPTCIVMPPMKTSGAGAHGVPTALHVTYYAQRALADLIIAEATQISAEGQGYLRTPGIQTSAQIAAWRNVTQAVHRAGGLIVL